MEKRIFLFIIIFLLITVYGSYAQSVHITWQGGDNALHYEIEIEKETEQGFARYLIQTTSDKFLDLSLPPGKYCYRIIPYDILERQGDATDWVYFDVKELEKEFLTESTEEEKEEFYREPHEQHEKEQKQKERKQRNYFVNIEAAYIPLLPVFGSSTIQPDLAGAALRAGINFPINAFTYIGPEVAGTWNDGIINAGLNIRLLRTINETKSSFVFKLGAEYAISLDNRVLASPYNLLAGLSFIWQITNIFYLEIGFDMLSTMNMPPEGFIRPWLGLGLRL